MGTITSWKNGDLNRDGKTDVTDFLLFRPTLPALGAGSLTLESLLGESQRSRTGEFLPDFYWAWICGVFAGPAATLREQLVPPTQAILSNPSCPVTLDEYHGPIRTRIPSKSLSLFLVASHDITRLAP